MSSRAVTPDDVVDAIKHGKDSDGPIVSSRTIKDWLESRGIDWGAPSGWSLKEAEEDERSSDDPRIVKFKCGPHSNSKNGFSLAEDREAALQVAKEKGWHLLG